MRTVLVTGSAGFVGRNLIARLRESPELEILEFDVDSGEDSLPSAAAKADFVFHLAGVNRPPREDDFHEGNKGLTDRLVGLLRAGGRPVPVLLSSSIQASMDNPYGRSKRGAEAAVAAYAQETGSACYTFRLPNVFGKWCRPNYNSVVATWCYNSTRGQPFRVDCRDTALSLVYIDDVVEAFLAALKGKATRDQEGFCVVPRLYGKTLGEIADLLEAFSKSRTGLMMPALSDDFSRKLYATWLSYLPRDAFAYDLEMKRDERGWLAEFIKSASFGQIFVSKTRPGVTRGRHWHHTKVEKFLVVSGEALIRFRKIDESEVLEYPVSGDRLKVVDIPVGFTHSITNVGADELLTIFWSDEVFDPSLPDTYFLEV